MPLRDPQHEVQLRVTSWKQWQQRNVVMQNREYTCGAAALATVLRYYWGDAANEETVLAVLTKMLSPAELRDRVINGLAISDLRLTAVRMGYEATIGTVSLEQLAAARAPVVVPIRLGKLDHFVVGARVAGGRVYLADPVRGNVRPTIEEFRTQWQKQAVLVVAKANVDPPASSPLSIRPGDVRRGDLTRQTISRQLPALGLPPQSR